MNNYYDGVLSKPFPSEHWYKGFVAACAIWLPVFFLLIEGINIDFAIAIWVASAVSIAVAIAAFTYHEGFSLDINQSRYRCYTWVLGLHFGKWHKLPSIIRVSVRAHQQRYYLPMADNSDPVDLGFVATERNWQVLLSVMGSPIGIVAAYANQKEATRIANVIGQLLNVKIIA